MKILSLTASGEEYLADHGVDLCRARAGGVEHEYWKWRVRLHLERQGYVVTEEAPVGGGKTVDLHATRGDQQLWIEVETGRSDVAANIEKCRALSGRVVFVFTNPTDRERYRVNGLTTAELDRL